MGSKGIVNKMTNKKVFELYDAFFTLKGLKGVQLNYAIARNTDYLKSEVEAMKKTLEASDGFKKYDEARIALAKKHAQKDEKGNPVIIGNEFQLEDKEVFDKEFAALKEEHKKEIEERQTQLKDFEKLLEEESSIEFHKIPVSTLPEDITTEQMVALLPIIIIEE